MEDDEQVTHLSWKENNPNLTNQQRKERVKVVQDVSNLCVLSGSKNLKNLLEFVYNGSENNDERIIAANYLGHSELLLRTKTHPVITTLKGIAITGASLGSIYATFHYINKIFN